MDNPGEILRLCRLCLVKDQVNIPIFEEQGDIRQTFLKIRSCLPVKVSRDDKLPKKICGGCSNKLDLFYEFWSSTANSEKTLQSWLGQEEEDDKMQEITKPVEALVKEESEALEDGHAHDQSFDEATKDEAEAPPAKRARRTAAVKAQINISHDSDEDEDVDGAEPITKIEDESDDSDGEEKDPSYTEVPGTSADDQAGPSGLGKDGVEAPPKIAIRKSPRKSKNKLTDYINEIFKESDDEDDLFETARKPKKEIDDDIYPCKKCCSIFLSKGDLLKHRKTTHRNNRSLDVQSKDEILGDVKRLYECRNCTEVFPTIQELRAHKKEHIKKEFVESHTYYFDATQEIYICNTCSAEFKDEVEAERHTKGHEEFFECSLCSDRFQSLFQLGSHLKASHNEDDNYRCPQCPELKFSKPSLFMKHIDTIHQKRYTYTCKECGKGFHSKSLCREHMNIHLGVKPFNCIVCGALFTYSKSVVTHQLKAHRVEILGESHRTECSFCRNRFVSIASLERHVQQVHATPKAPKGKIHLCDYCGMGFAKKNKMVVHQRVHTGVKPYPCRYCDKCFSKSGERNCHERIHTGERPYSCKYCGKAFRQSAPFKVHIRTHTGERPYVCDLCRKGFTTNQGLKLHRKRCTSID
ncbi:zinc finger protein 25-like isoform X13 [Euwallacea similis]|uniref:zinc finger protein 25-like isoform X13 n=1 Tax=Euwallacea similis TaxID=1736056 RepID=UPI00344E3BFD